MNIYVIKKLQLHKVVEPLAQLALAAIIIVCLASGINKVNMLWYIYYIYLFISKLPLPTKK